VGYQYSPPRRKRTGKPAVYPMLGEFVTELHIPAVTPEEQPQNLVYERTLRTPGHHTLWAAPALLLACVTRVAPVLRSP